MTIKYRVLFVAVCIIEVLNNYYLNMCISCGQYCFYRVKCMGFTVKVIGGCDDFRRFASVIYVDFWKIF